MDLERIHIDANGFTFSVRAAGPPSGRPVILLHGFPQTSWSWRATLLALGNAGYRAIAPDQRGYSPGARPVGVENYAIAHLTSDVLSLADTLEIDTFDLVGHDWGGMVGWVIGARHPERVRSLCVVSTPHPAALRTALDGADPDQKGRSGYIQTFRQPDVPEQLLLGEDGSGSGLRKLFTRSGLEAELAEEYVTHLCEPGALTAALNWYRASHPADAEVLPVVVPTLYIWSTEDNALGRPAAEATAEYVAGRYRFEILEGVSHWIPDVASEALNELLLEHLADS